MRGHKGSLHRGTLKFSIIFQFKFLKIGDSVSFAKVLRTVAPASYVPLLISWGNCTVSHTGRTDSHSTNSARGLLFLHILATLSVSCLFFFPCLLISRSDSCEVWIAFPWWCMMTSPGGHHGNQADYVLCSQRWRSAISSVQLRAVAQSCPTLCDPWIAARQASLSITISRSSLRLTSIESVMPTCHLILGRSLLLLPPIPPSIRVFPNESTLHMRWPKYWSFSFSIIPEKEYVKAVYFHPAYSTSMQST